MGRGLGRRQRAAPATRVPAGGWRLVTPFALVGPGLDSGPRLALAAPDGNTWVYGDQQPCRVTAGAGSCGPACVHLAFVLDASAAGVRADPAGWAATARLDRSAEHVRWSTADGATVLRVTAGRRPGAVLVELTVVGIDVLGLRAIEGIGGWLDGADPDRLGCACTLAPCPHPAIVQVARAAGWVPRSVFATTLWRELNDAAAEAGGPELPRTGVDALVRTDPETGWHAFWAGALVARRGAALALEVTGRSSGYAWRQLRARRLPTARTDPATALARRKQTFRDRGYTPLPF